MPYQFIDPISQEFLVEKDGQLLNPNTNSTFPIENGLINLLKVSGPVTSDFHQQMGTEFNYQEHYQFDAQYFDYFEEPTGAHLHGDVRRFEAIERLIPKTTKTILDVGSGNAWVAERFCPKGVSVVSMDISVENVRKALDRIPHKNHSGVVADAFALPFAPQQFDLVISSEVIEHVGNPSEFAKSLWQMVKPGGKLLISTGYKEKIVYNICVHCNHPTPANAHLHSFDEHKLKALLPNLAKEGTFFFETYLNKALVHLRTHYLLQHFPFPAWKMVDNMANAVIKKPNNITVVFTRNK